jgi:putative DNA primase/helicase
VDLRTGTIREHCPSDLITQLCPVEFDPDAKCPLWDRTLGLFFADDQRLIAYWQRLCGYALVGVVRDHILAVAYGKGSNGKSTILGTLIDMLGDYAMKTPPDMLMAKLTDSHPTDRADLFRKRLVVAIETEAGRRLNETMVKELTGGDRIRARRMREDFWEFPPTHTLVMATNHKPVVRSTDRGIWRRIRLIPFVVSVEDGQADKAMPEKLRAEYPGILAWCVRGCLAWQQVGLYEPDSVSLATGEYREEANPVRSFLAEHTIRHANGEVQASALYGRYRQWAEANGEDTMPMKLFAETLADEGLTKVKKSSIFYSGILLRDAAAPRGGPSNPGLIAYT